MVSGMETKAKITDRGKMVNKILFAILFFIFMPIIAWLCNDTAYEISIWQLYLGELALVWLGVIALLGFAKLL